MKGLANYTVKSLRANKVRTLVTIVGIALAAALVTAVFTTFTSLAHFLGEAQIATNGAWMAEASVDDAQELEEGLCKAEADPAITGVAALRQVGYGELTPEQQRYLGDAQPVVSAEGNVDELCAIRASEGRMPERAGELLLFATWKVYGGVELGDELTLPVGQLDQQVTTTAPADALEGVDVQPQSEVRIVDAHERTYTVVGFYDRVSSALVDAHGGTVGVTVDDPEADGPAQAFLSLAHPGDAAAVEDAVHAVFPDTSITLHSALLRYLGVSSDLSIWNTFYGLVCVLAGVILIACVSLIFNAFNISVAERMNQFGLLSSVGATRPQLRRAVLLEALIVAVIGIPCGLLLGIGGCGVTFACLGPAISNLTGADGVPFALAVDGRMVAIAAALTLATVLVSAWVPAKRASRMSIISSIRTTGSTRISRKGEARAAKATDASRLWKGGSLGARLFGVGVRLAQLNRARSRSKGRAASASLALAVVLLMTAGSLNVFLSQLVDAATNGEPAGEVSVAAQFEEADDAELAADAQLFQDAYARLSEAPNAVPVGWRMSGHAVAEVPESMQGDGFAYLNQQVPEEDEGSPVADARICYLQDDQFDAFAEGLGIDPSEFRIRIPRAIGISKAYGNDGKTYRLQEMLCGTGTVEVNEQAVEVVALTDEPPILAGSYGEGISLIVPASMAQTCDLVEDEVLFRSYFDAADGDHAGLAKELDDIGHSYFDGVSAQRMPAFVSYNDYRAESDSNQMLATVVNVFCLLFTVILALIAMANVFNTVTNSLVLRKREFAVMRSVGLSPRQFRRMIVDECASFGVAGLVPGLVLSVGVAFLVWLMVAQSLSDLPFLLPWGYLGAAVGMTALIMAVSVAYGMHRCKADSIVEALRTE